MHLSTAEAVRQANEVLAILESGAYVSAEGSRVELGQSLADARTRTVSFPPDKAPPTPAPTNRRSCIEVVEATTLDVARCLVDRNLRPVALNFANACFPGGGFLGGALAQEESLCRASGLFGCLVGDPMYAFHADRGDTLYTDYVIYSPDVPVFRGEDGALLERSWSCSFLTSPAPFAPGHLAAHPEGHRDLESAFTSRIAKVLAVAAHHGHEALVLGAWGCGAFGNDSHMVAREFRDALAGPFRGVFTHISFAITDSTSTRRRIGPFEAALSDLS